MEQCVTHARRCLQDKVPASDAKSDMGQTIPLDKIEDFGHHANQYYALEVSYFKSSLDQVCEADVQACTPTTPISCRAG
jgi:hypothetical protein